MSKKIFIFGSKPNTKIPSEKCDLIFSANGGAYYANKYLKKIKKSKILHTNISTDQVLLKYKSLENMWSAACQIKLFLEEIEYKLKIIQKKSSPQMLKLNIKVIYLSFYFKEKFLKEVY